MACKMIKKGVVGAALGAGALALLFGTAAPSYVKTAFCRVRSNVKDGTPIPFKIDLARQQVADLTPAIRDNIEDLARAEEEVKQLRDEIVAMDTNQGRERKAILALRESLDSGNLRLATGSVSYTPEEIKADLRRRFDHYQEVKKILVEKESTLKARERSVIAAREMLMNVQAQRQSLLTKIEEIEARHKSIEASRVQNEFQFDDSALARAKQTISELDRQLNVMARTAELEGRFADPTVPVAVDRAGDVLNDVDAEFGRDADDEAAHRDGTF